MHHAADLEQFVLVMHHVFASETRNRVIFSQKNRLLRTNFLAHPAKNAANHVYIKFFRVFLDLGEAIVPGNFTGNNLYRARRTNEFAKLASNAADPAVSVANERWRAAVMLGQVRVPLLFGIFHRYLRAAENHVLEMLERDRESGRYCRQKHSFAPVQVRSWNDDRHDFLDRIYRSN